MEKADEIKFHSDRALAELDRARTAADPAAARAHLALSALHVDRLRALSAATVAGPSLQPVRS